MGQRGLFIDRREGMVRASQNGRQSMVVLVDTVTRVIALLSAPDIAQEVLHLEAVRRLASPRS